MVTVDERQARLRRVLAFLVVFAALSVPVHAVMWTGWELPWLRAATAGAVGAVLRGVGVEATVRGPLVAAGEMVVNVSWDSTGWKSVTALVALMVASRQAWRRTVAGVAAGVPLLLLANVGRIASMVVLERWFGVPYGLLHTVLWRWGLTVVVLAVWLAWLRPPFIGRWRTGLGGRGR